MPSDWVSFVWGAVVAAIAIVASGLLKAATTDFYKWIKEKVKPQPNEPVQVERNYQPEDADGESYSWVTDAKLLRLEFEGYIYYLHPTAKTKCFRLVRSGNGNQFKEWLMKKPV